MSGARSCPPTASRRALYGLWSEIRPLQRGRTHLERLLGGAGNRDRHRHGRADLEFRRCAECCQGGIRLQGSSCWNQYLAMAFSQLTYCESLLDIEAWLGIASGNINLLLGAGPERARPCQPMP